MGLRRPSIASKPVLRMPLMLDFEQPRHVARTQLLVFFCLRLSLLLGAEESNGGCERIQASLSGEWLRAPCAFGFKDNECRKSPRRWAIHPRSSPRGPR